MYSTYAVCILLECFLVSYNILFIVYLMEFDKTRRGRGMWGAEVDLRVKNFIHFIHLVIIP